jgi:hypothetical protein
MSSTGEADRRRDLWICPKCGARLISRNLWHSCGRFTLEDLFRNSPPEILELARRYVELLHSLGDVQVIPQKTRLVCVARVRFAGLSPRKNGFRVAFALRRWLKSARIVKTEDYGPRWRAHFVDIRSAGDLDDELKAWLKESHDTVGIQSDELGRRQQRTIRWSRDMGTDLPIRLMLVDAPPGVDFGIQHGSGSKYRTLFVQQATDGDVVFDFSVSVTEHEKDGSPDFKGPFAQGPPGGRFIYIDVGTYAGQKDTAWARRMKVPLKGITRSIIKQATSKPGHKLAARIPGKAKDGGPNCATVQLIGRWEVINARTTRGRR